MCILWSILLFKKSLSLNFIHFDADAAALSIVRSAKHRPLHFKYMVIMSVCSWIRLSSSLDRNSETDLLSVVRLEPKSRETCESTRLKYSIIITLLYVRKNILQCMYYLKSIFCILLYLIRLMIHSLTIWVMTTAQLVAMAAPMITI